MEPVIEKRFPRTERYNPDFARAFGLPELKPAYYVHLVTEIEYSYLAGGASFGTLGGKPGCAVVVGVSRDESPVFEVLDAVFESSPRELMKGCLLLQRKYGWDRGGDIFRFWTGENRFPDILYSLNDDDGKVYFSLESDSTKPTWPELVVEDIRFLAAEKRLIVSHPGVLAELKAYTVYDADKGLEPTLSALGGVLHYLSSVEPWTRSATTFNYDEFGKRAIHY
jgi:hypothetical protein